MARAKGAVSGIDKQTYKSTGNGKWELDGGSGKYGYVTILKTDNLYKDYDGVKHIYEVSVVSADFEKHADNKFYDGFVQAKRWGKERLKEFNK